MTRNESVEYTSTFNSRNKHINWSHFIEGSNPTGPVVYKYFDIICWYINSRSKVKLARLATVDPQNNQSILCPTVNV